MSWLPHILQNQIQRMSTHHVLVTSQAADGATIAILDDPGLQDALAIAYLGASAAPSLHTDYLPAEAAPALQKLSKLHGLAICPADVLPPDDRAAALIVPRYVCLSIPLPATLLAYHKNLGATAAAEFALIAAQEFHLRITHDADLLPEFYADFFAPTVAASHGGEPVASTLPELQAILAGEKAEFIQIFLDEQWVAGAMAVREPERYRLVCHGWLNGDSAFLERGARAAVYHAVLDRACNLGVPTLVLGNTLPFLEDPLFAYKTQWGAQLDAQETRSADSAWLLNPAHPHVHRFFEAHTLIARGQDNRFIAFGAAKPLTDATCGPLMGSLSAWYRLLPAPDPATATTHPEVPALLRPWFVSEALTRSL